MSSILPGVRKRLFSIHGSFMRIDDFGQGTLLHFVVLLVLIGEACPDLVGKCLLSLKDCGMRVFADFSQRPAKEILELNVLIVFEIWSNRLYKPSRGNHG